MPEKKTLFLSYSHEDSAFASKLRASLATVLPTGIDLIGSDDVLRPGEEVIAGISNAISQSDGVIFVLPQTPSSNWLPMELSIALAQEMRGRQFRVFPVAIDDNRYVPHLLRDRVYLRFSNDVSFRENVSQLAAALLKENLYEQRGDDGSLSRLIEEQRQAIEEDARSLERMKEHESIVLRLSLAGSVISAVLAALGSVWLVWSDSQLASILAPVIGILSASLGYWFGFGSGSQLRDYGKLTSRKGAERP